MAVLSKGANASLAGTNVEAVLEWAEGPGVAHDIDLCGLVVGADGKVRDDSDLVFYNQPRHSSGAVTHKGRIGTKERLSIEVNQLPDDVEKVVLVGSITGGTFGAVEGLAIAVVDAAGGYELRFDTMGATNETALVVGELYRRNGEWKSRAVGQGWESGLAALATNYGVSIDTSAEPGLVPEATPGPFFEAAPAPMNLAAAEPASPRAPDPTYTPPAETASTPASEVPRAPKRIPLPVATATPGTPNMDGKPLTLSIGQNFSLLRQGQTPKTLWLRVTHTGNEAAVRADLGILSYDAYGTPRDIVYYGSPTDPMGNIRLLNKPTTDSPTNTAAVELNFSSFDGSVTGLVVGVTSYDGKVLTPNGAFVIELVAPDGTVHARSESPAPEAIGALLLTLKRDSEGAWVLTPLASAAPGRTAKGLVGAGRWALGA